MKRLMVTGCALWMLLAATGAAAQTIYVAGHAPAAELDCPPDNRLRASRPRPPAAAAAAAAPAAEEPEVVNEVPDEAEVGEALAEAEPASATTSADGFPLLFQSPRRLRIGLWGDSHAAAHIFSDALVQALGLADRRVLPSFIPPTMGNAGVRLPLRRACMGPGWSPEHAYRNRTPGATFSRALTRTGSYRAGAYLWLDFRSAALADSFRTLDIRLSPGPADPRVFERPAVGDEAGLGSALEPGEEVVAEAAAVADGGGGSAPASGAAASALNAGGGVMSPEALAGGAGAPAPDTGPAVATAAAPAADRLPVTPGLPRYSAPTVLKLSINDDPAQVLELEAAKDNLLRIVAEQPIATLKLELVEGSVGLDGFVPHYDIEPDYLFDTLGIPGATARGLQFMGAEWDVDDPWPPYDLLLVEFGTNEGNYGNFNAGDYAQELRRSLATLRGLHPGATCVLIGPTDRGVHVPKPRVAMKTIKVKQCKGKGKKRKCKTVLKQVPKCTTRKCRARAKAAARVKVDLLRYARIHATISQVQREVGKDFQCHAWSWQDAMGGPGGIYGWVRRSLAQRDLIHLTGAGYRLSAQLFAQKLLGTTEGAGEAAGAGTAPVQDQPPEAPEQVPSPAP